MSSCFSIRSIGTVFQGGEFAFVLLAQTQAMGILPAQFAGEISAVVALSMALTPLALLVYQKRFAAENAAAAAGKREADKVDHSSPVILAGFGRFGNFVGRLLRAQGFRAVVLEADTDHVELTRRLGFEVHYGDATRLDVLHAAGAAEAKLFIIAIDDEEAIDRLVAECRRHFPNLELLVRAKDMDHRLRLLNSGVTHVFHEVSGSALDLGTQALRLLGLPAYTAERSARRFRRHDITTARELAPHAADRETYFSMVKARVDELDALFSRDPLGPENRDAEAWEPMGGRKDDGQAKDSR